MGEKVFTMADPNLLLCVSAHDGKALWQTAIDHATAMPAAKRDQARAEQAFIAELRRSYGRWLLRMADFEKKLEPLRLSLKALAILDEKGGKKESDPGSDAGLDLDGDAGGRDTIMGPDGPIAAAIVAEYRALCKDEKTNNFARPSGQYGNGISVKEDNALTRRLIRANRDYDLYLTDNWGEPWTTLTFATPCTDGASLYVATANNAVARVGLDGTVKWLVWDHVPDRDQGSSGWWNGTGIGTRFVPSPVYFQGKLIVNQNGELRVYDAANGKKLWSVFDPHKKRGGQFPWRPVPEACGVLGTVVALPDGSRLPLVTDGLAFFRLDDGVMLAGRFDPVGGTSPVIVGDVMFWKIHPPPQSPRLGAQRFRAVSRDEMAIESVWGDKTGGSGYSNVYLDGRLYAFNRVYQVADGAGSPLDPGLDMSKGKAGIGHVSPIVAGDHHYCFTDAGAGWVFPIKGGPAIELEAAHDDKRVNTDREWQERYAWTGNMQHGSPCAQANRLFLRTKGYLWCFGDPKVPFPVPKDCPADARIPPVNRGGTVADGG
jgi:hypothetical protein